MVDAQTEIMITYVAKLSNVWLDESLMIVGNAYDAIIYKGLPSYVAFSKKYW